MPAALQDVVLRCLAKKPEDRPATAPAPRAALAALTLEEPWTDEVARGWWDRNLPGAAKPSDSPDSLAATMPLPSGP